MLWLPVAHPAVALFAPLLVAGVVVAQAGRQAS
jgi:hypothetical protein